MPTKPKHKKKIQTYPEAAVLLGVSLEKDGNNQYKGDCPLCDKNDHFFMNETTGQWDCKVCGERGNYTTLLTLLVTKTAKETHRKDLEKLAAARGLPAEAFKGWDVGWTGSEWWIPVWSDKGTVRDIKRWNGKGLYVTPFCKSQLFNFPALIEAPQGSTVWLCEGEWDTIALSWLLKKAGRTKDVVVGTSAAVFKEDWKNWFKGQHVRIVFDNDEAGEQGMARNGKTLKGIARSISYIWWPSDLKTGWDIRDAIQEGVGKDLSAEEGVAQIETLLRSSLRADGASPAKTPPPGGGPTKGPGESLPGGSGETPADFQQVMDVFKKWCFVDQAFEDATAVTLATIMSTDIPGDPVWMYIVGPPSSGKSIILTATAMSERVTFHSSLTPKSLVSGYETEPDPSLLPTFNEKTAVFKDGTELLAAHPEARRETFGILRGAYDSRVDREYGNGVKRNYRDLHFSVLMGVTDAIHGENNATMGERFLKFSMPENPATVKKKMLAAIQNFAKDVERDQSLAEIVRKFLLRRIDPNNLPELPEWTVNRIMGLAQMIGKLRAQVTREIGGDRELSYRPSTEVGIRAAKQLAKLTQSLMAVYGLDEPNAEMFRVVEKVAEDSAIGFHIDIVRAIVNHPYGLTAKDLVEHIRVSHTTISRRLEDLRQLDILYKVDQDKEDARVTVGAVPQLWKMTKHVRKIWEEAYEMPEGLNGFHKLNGKARH